MLYTGNSISSLFDEAIQVKHGEEDNWLLGLAPWGSNSNCLVLIPHRKLWKYLFGTGKSIFFTGQHMHEILVKSMFALTNKFTHKGPRHHAALYPSASL